MALLLSSFLSRLSFLNLSSHVLLFSLASPNVFSSRRLSVYLHFAKRAKPGSQCTVAAQPHTSLALRSCACASVRASTFA
eukprot:6214639-Pleurochrysis_carterae.AAC.3